MPTGWATPAAELGQRRRELDALYRGEGVDPATMKLGFLSYCHVTDDKAEARRYVECARFQNRLSQALRRRKELVHDDFWVEEAPFEGETSLDELLAVVPVGDPHVVAERMVELLREVKPYHLALYCQLGDLPKRLALRSMERFMAEVAPPIEKAFGAPLAEINAPIPSALAAG